MRATPSNISTLTTWLTERHPVLGSGPEVFLAEEHENPEREFEFHFSMLAKTGYASILRPPEKILSLFYASTIKVIASGSANGKSHSIDRDYSIRSGRDDLFDYDLFPDSFAERMASMISGRRLVHYSSNEDGPIAVESIEDEVQVGEVGEIGNNGLVFSVTLPSIFDLCFLESGAVPARWAFFSFNSSVNAFDIIEHPEQDTPPSDPPRQQIITEGIYSVDIDKPGSSTGDITFMGEEIRHEGDSGFSLTITVESTLPISL